MCCVQEIPGLADYFFETGFERANPRDAMTRQKAIIDFHRRMTESWSETEGGLKKSGEPERRSICY